MRMLVIGSVLLVAITALPAGAQTAERLDDILDADNLSVGETAYLAAASAGLVSETASNAAALRALRERGLSIDPAARQQEARLDEFAYMLMLAFDRDGGILYSLFPGPRYALRELEFERVIQGGGDPADPIGGQRALRFVGRLRQIAAEEE